jgi:hypothetical protein
VQRLRTDGGRPERTRGGAACVFFAVSIACRAPPPSLSLPSSLRVQIALCLHALTFKL